MFVKYLIVVFLLTLHNTSFAFVHIFRMHHQKFRMLMLWKLMKTVAIIVQFPIIQCRLLYLLQQKMLTINRKKYISSHHQSTDGGEIVVYFSM